MTFHDAHHLASVVGRFSAGNWQVSTLKTHQAVLWRTEGSSTTAHRQHFLPKVCHSLPLFSPEKPFVLCPFTNTPLLATMRSVLAFLAACLLATQSFAFMVANQVRVSSSLSSSSLYMSDSKKTGTVKWYVVFRFLIGSLVESIVLFLSLAW